MRPGDVLFALLALVVVALGASVGIRCARADELPLPRDGGWSTVAPPRLELPWPPPDGGWAQLTPAAKLVSVRTAEREVAHVDPLPDGGARVVVNDWCGLARALPALAQPRRTATEVVTPDGGACAP